MTGYELARQVLDRRHLTRTTVYSISAGQEKKSGVSFGELPLTEKVYFGTSLTQLTQALHETVHHLEAAKRAVSVWPGNPVGRLFRGFVVSGWVLVASGIFLPGWILILGQTVLVSSFFTALVSLPGEWESADHAVAHLASLERLGTDERIQIKGLLKVLGWFPLSEIVGIPIQVLSPLQKKLKGDGKKVKAAV